MSRQLDELHWRKGSIPDFKIQTIQFDLWHCDARKNTGSDGCVLSKGMVGITHAVEWDDKASRTIMNNIESFGLDVALLLAHRILALSGSESSPDGFFCLGRCGMPWMTSWSGGQTKGLAPVTVAHSSQVRTRQLQAQMKVGDTDTLASGWRGRIAPRVVLGYSVHCAQFGWTRHNYDMLSLLLPTGFIPSLGCLKCMRVISLTAPVHAVMFSL